MRRAAGPWRPPTPCAPSCGWPAPTPPIRRLRPRADRTTYRDLLAQVAGAQGRRPRLVDAGIAGDVVTRVALSVASRSEPEVAALEASLPAPEAVAHGTSLLRIAELPITPLASAIRAAVAGGRRRGN
jgi:hypothetical protein